MKKFVLFLSVLLSFTFAGAQNRYGIKSAIIRMSAEAAGQKTEITQYFDDYGAKETIETAVSVGAQRMEIVTLTRDGATYVADKVSGKVQKMPVAGDVVNYLDLKPEIASKFNIKEIGKESFLGRECTKYSQTVQQAGQKADALIWVWKGITLKSEISIAGMKITQTAVEVKENAKIDPAKFEVPKF